jgi:hypothetical protein
MIGAVAPSFNIDDVHRDVLDELLAEENITAFSAEDRRAIASRWHQLDAWPDFVPALASCDAVIPASPLQSSACHWSSMSLAAMQ